MGTLNLIFDDDKTLGDLLKARLGEPFAMLDSARCDPSRDPYHFHKVRIFHDSLPKDGALAFLWYPRKKRGTSIIYKPPRKPGRLEFAAETVDAEPGSRMSVDFSEALTDNPGAERPDDD